MDWFYTLATVGVDTSRDVLPIVAIIFGFQLLVLRRSIPQLRRMLVGLLYVVLGMALFLLGLEHVLFPLGRPDVHPRRYERAQRDSRLV
jgi:hypothetical protein